MKRRDCRTRIAHRVELVLCMIACIAGLLAVWEGARGNMPAGATILVTMIAGGCCVRGMLVCLYEIRELLTLRRGP